MVRCQLRGWPSIWRPAGRPATTGAHISGNKALTLLPPPQVGVICMAEVPAGAFIGLLVFGESFGLQTLIGGMLIIVAGIGLNISRVNHAKNLPR